MATATRSQRVYDHPDRGVSRRRELRGLQAALQSVLGRVGAQRGKRWPRGRSHTKDVLQGLERVTETDRAPFRGGVSTLGERCTR